MLFRTERNFMHVVCNSCARRGTRVCQHSPSLLFMIAIISLRVLLLVMATLLKFTHLFPLTAIYPGSLLTGVYPFSVKLRSRTLCDCSRTLFFPFARPFFSFIEYFSFQL